MLAGALLATPGILWSIPYLESNKNTMCIKEESVTSVTSTARMYLKKPERAETCLLLPRLKQADKHTLLKHLLVLLEETPQPGLPGH